MLLLAVEEFFTNLEDYLSLKPDELPLLSTDTLYLVSKTLFPWSTRRVLSQPACQDCQTVKVNQVLVAPSNDLTLVYHSRGPSGSTNVTRWLETLIGVSLSRIYPKIAST